MFRCELSFHLYLAAMWLTRWWEVRFVTTRFYSLLHVTGFCGKLSLHPTWDQYDWIRWHKSGLVSILVFTYLWCQQGQCRTGLPNLPVAMRLSDVVLNKPGQHFCSFTGGVKGASRNLSWYTHLLMSYFHWEAISKTEGWADLLPDPSAMRQYESVPHFFQ